MIQQVTYYKTSDGKIFERLYDAEVHEDAAKKCEEALYFLNTGGHVVSGTQAFQHNPALVKSAFKEFIRLCCTMLPEHEEIFKATLNGSANWTHMYKIMSDYNHDYPFLWKAYFRFRCISESGVEYNQPGFVFHPEEFKGVVVTYTA